MATAGENLGAWLERGGARDRRGSGKKTGSGGWWRFWAELGAWS